MSDSSLAVCPFCEELVGDDAVQYGAERLHPECHEELGKEMHESK
jgi:hypothetical protein